ncbi:MAG: WYL domain-containing protein [Sulfitobacter sp.]|nr:WYL domain-containing protein [Sulfitobacter sp.]
MTRTNAKDRLRRLELLAAQLKQDEMCTVRSLADLHGVSERTIARDLQLMRDQGLPIDADRGRGGGVRLDRNWGVGRLNLNYPEAVDLLISLAVAEQMNSPLFFANLGSVRRQLIASFSPDKRHRVSGLKARILIGTTASTHVQTTVAPSNNRAVQRLHQAFLDQRALLISYKAESGKLSERTIEPHYLLLNYPVWYVLAFDQLRQAERAFRCDRIIKSEITETRFKLSPKETFRQSLEGNPVI